MTLRDEGRLTVYASRSSHASERVSRIVCVVRATALDGNDSNGAQFLARVVASAPPIGPTHDSNAELRDHGGRDVRTRTGDAQGVV